MQVNRDRLELCITYMAPNISVGVRPGSIEFVDRTPAAKQEMATMEGHVALEPEVSFYVNTDEFSVGRSVNNDLVIDSAKISRSHMKIRAGADESYHVQDLGSANGTMLNGKALEKLNEYHLRAGGEIQLAGILHIKFTDFGATFVAPETLTVFGLSLSHADRTVWVQGREADGFKLSNSEYKFLSLLMEGYPDHVTHADLGQAIWEYTSNDADDEKRARDALFNIAKRLRERLQIVDPDYEYIETVRKWGDREGGYKFNKH
jgi:pSer/pThr/pTyr-binding forkhead associated (FHA) protein